MSLSKARKWLDEKSSFWALADLSNFLLCLIRSYQRFVSPRKGFSCAYRICTGCASCSELGYRAIRRFGVWRGLGVLDARLARCRLAAQALSVRRYRPRAQAGDCDLPCDVGDVCDVGDCVSNCDWPSRGRKEGRRANRKPARLPETEMRRRREEDDPWRG